MWWFYWLEIIVINDEEIEKWRFYVNGGFREGLWVLVLLFYWWWKMGKWLGSRCLYFFICEYRR